MTPITGAVYEVIVSGITGSGTLGLNLVDNGTIQDLAGNALSQQNGVGNGNFTGQLYTVSGPATAHFAFSGIPITTLAGNSFGFTLTALDQSNNLVTAYTGTVHFTTTDTSTAAALPADYTFVPADGGIHVFTAATILVTARTQVITATDTAVSTNTSSVVISVSPLAATQLVVNAPGTIPAGTSFTLTVSALDSFGNTATSYSGTVHFASSDTRAVLPADAILTNGAGTFSATLLTAGNQTIAATDTVSSTLKLTSAAISVSPAGATHFAVTAPGTDPAGGTIGLTVTVLDQYGNTVTAYGGTVHFTSSDAQAALPSNAILTNGMGIFNVTLITSGAQIVTATDTAAAITGSSTVTVKAGAATHYLVVAPATTVAGTAITVTVTAQDSLNNTATGYAGTVHFTSSDSQAVLPADATLSNGVGKFSVTLKTAGLSSITATDTANSALSGTQTTISVAVSAFSQFVVTGLPLAATAGATLGFTVASTDSFGNVITGYTGTVRFSSNDPLAALPANATLTNGVGKFSVTFKTAGIGTVTATDKVTTSITGISNALSVSAAAASQFTITAPGAFAQGTPFSFSIEALDTYGNVAVGYAGTVHFSSSDSQAALPTDTTLTQGSAILSATFNTSSLLPQTLTAADTVTASVTGNAVLAAHSPVTLSIPTTLSTVQGSVVTVPINVNSLLDTLTGFSGLIGADFVIFYDPNVFTVSSSDVQLGRISTGGSTAVGKGYSTTVANGWVVASNIGTPGQLVVGLSNQGNGIITGSASGSLVTINFHVNSNAPAGTTKLDLAANDFRGPPGTEISDQNASTYVLSPAPVDNVTTLTPYTYVGNDPDDGTVTITGTGPHLAVAAPVGATAGAAFSITVTAENANDSTITGYTGTVHLTSSDSRAVLPADATLTNGAGTFLVTLLTAGIQSFTATDTATASIEGNSGLIGVNPAGVEQVALSGTPSSIRAGTPFNFTLTSEDQYGNETPAFTGSVHFASSDNLALLPIDGTLKNGVATFNATFEQVGNFTLSVSAAAGGVAGSSAAIDVTGPAVQYLLTAPASIISGTPFNLTLTALDFSNNLDKGYNGTVHFSTSDSQALIPPNAILTNGQGVFSVALITTGTQTITATDTAISVISAVSNISVVASTVPHFAVVAPAFITAGTPTSFTVVAENGNNSTNSAYIGTVHFSSSDSQAVLPADATLTNGTGLFNATLETAALQSVIATDAANSVSGAATADVILPGASPFVESINRTTPAGPSTSASNVAYTVTFSKPVVGVNASNFALALTGTVSATLGSVTAVSDSVYTVIVNGITGSGTVGLNLANNGGIHDLAGNDLVALNPTFAFQPQLTLPAGFSPMGVAIADINSDGKPDLIFANAHSNSVGVLLSNGNGTFQNQITSAAPGQPWLIAAADFNGDGKPDVLLSNVATNNDTLLLGNGNGTFQSPMVVATGTGPYGIAEGDLNGDGILDLATLAYGQAKTHLNVLLGNGNGTFRLANTYLAAPGAHTVTIGDVNGDGIPDLIVLNETVEDNVSVFLGTGGGKFQAQAATFGTWAAIGPVKIADVNGDGKPDLVIANGYGAVTLLLGNGNGTFQNAVTVGTSLVTESVAVADVNGDGKQDIVVANPVNDSVGVLLGNGNGTFQPEFTFAVGSVPRSVAVADLNGDGKPDVVVTNYSTSSYKNSDVSLLFNATNTNFTGQIYIIDPSAPFGISAPAVVLANTPVTVTVTATTSTGNTLAGFTGTVHFSSSNSAPGTILPADYTFTTADHGEHVFTKGIFLAGMPTGRALQTITVVDSAINALVSTATLNVAPLAMAGFAISAPTSALAGSPVAFTVTAVDQNGDAFAGYNGTVHFASSDSLAVLPGDVTLTNGIGKLNATLSTLGNQTLTVSDISNAGLAATATLYVNVDHFVFVGLPAGVKAGTGFLLAVEAQNPAGNTDTSFTGTIHFSSTDLQAQIPADTTLTAGVGVFAVELKTAGNQSFTATADNGTGISAAIAVGAAAANHLAASPCRPAPRPARPPRSPSLPSILLAMLSLPMPAPSTSPAATALPRFHQIARSQAASASSARPWRHRAAPPSLPPI